MKKHELIKMPKWVVVMGLVFGLVILGVSATRQATAQEGMSEAVESKFEVEQMVIEADEAEVIDYYLPYPGILPDHPMYWLKMVRDKIQLVMMSNSVSKVEKQLLYADKRLGAGWALIEGNKIQLGVTTLTKAEKYLEQANYGVSQLEGEEAFKTKLKKATRKHNEVLQLIQDKIGEEYSSVMNQMIKMTSGGEKMGGEYKLTIDDGEEVVEYASTEAKTALELLESGAESEGIEVVVKEYDFGSLVDSIGGKVNTPEKAWIYYVNGESATVGVDQYELQDGDVIEWKYIKPKL